MEQSDFASIQCTPHTLRRCLYHPSNGYFSSIQTTPLSWRVSREDEVLAIAKTLMRVFTPGTIWRRVGARMRLPPTPHSHALDRLFVQMSSPCRPGPESMLASDGPETRKKLRVQKEGKTRQTPNTGAAKRGYRGCGDG